MIVGRYQVSRHIYSNSTNSTALLYFHSAKIILIQIRDDIEEMEDAIIEWYLIGEADLCLSPTIGKSTFGQTSVVRGRCKFIDIRKKAKNVYPPTANMTFEGDAKEFLVYNKDATSFIAKLDLQMQKASALKSDKRQELWNSVQKSEGTVYQQCVPPSEITNGNFIEKFWL